jgi:hypothetical protein
MVAGFVTVNQRGIFEVKVDQTSVQQLLTMSELAVSPPQLVLWMERRVQPYLADKIVERFAYNGTDGVDWLPLQESTLRIRHSMGQYDDFAINERTGEMMEWLVGNHQIETDPLGATLTIPGDMGDEVMQKKIQTAQEGRSEFNPLFGDVSHTPPRPVLAIGANDEKQIMASLMSHIMQLIGVLSNLGPVV